jgi:hypothetical protein
MAIIFEHDADHTVGVKDSDGMADLIAEAEADGWEGEHVFDANVEVPPHPFWDPITRRCKKD